jgi:hypothetical protein
MEYATHVGPRAHRLTGESVVARGLALTLEAGQLPLIAVASGESFYSQSEIIGGGGASGVRTPLTRGSTCPRR